MPPDSTNRRARVAAPAARPVDMHRFTLGRIELPPQEPLEHGPRIPSLLAWMLGGGGLSAQEEHDRAE